MSKKKRKNTKKENPKRVLLTNGLMHRVTDPDPGVLFESWFFLGGQFQINFFQKFGFGLG